MDREAMRGKAWDWTSKIGIPNHWDSLTDLLLTVYEEGRKAALEEVLERGKDWTAASGLCGEVRRLLALAEKGPDHE